jgi:Flp pilus assembly protein TadG
MLSYIASLLATSLGGRSGGRRRTGKGVTVKARGFAADTSGSVAVLFSLMLVALCVFVGAAVDLSRWYQARSQTIAAMDAAVLAGGRALQLNSSNVSGAKDAAQKFYAENTKDRAPVESDTITFNAVDNNTAFAASGNAYIKMSFLGLANITKLPLLDKSEATYSKAVLAAGGSSNSTVEISMMLDVTGSMQGTKITDLKKAATDLVNIVISDSPMANPVRVAIVPFAEGVRLPTSANTKARGTPAANVSLTSQQYVWGQGWQNVTVKYYKTECVVERSGTNKYTDVAPGSGKYVMTLFNNAGNNGSSGKCGLAAADELVPLTNNKTTLTNKITNLVLSGSTAGQVGTAWAWYTLSPNWNTLWSASSAASSYTSGVRKIAILMTDGEYNTEYDSHGVQTGAAGAGAAVNADSTTQARAVCAGMKTAGITVYTVGFDLGNNQTAIDTLSQCATDPNKAYTATNGAQLQQAFRDIALKISQLYLTQ